MPTTAGAPPHPVLEPGGSGRRRPRVVAAVVVAAALVLAGTTYGVVHAIDAAALSQTRVFLDARSLSCADPADVTTVARGADDGSGDDVYAVPAVRGTADLDCRLSVVVQNDSDRTLKVDRVTFTLLGPASRVGLRTDYALTQGLRPYRTSDDDDVVYDYVHDPDNRAPFPVAAGGVQRFVFHLTSDGCRQAGASTTWNGSPAFTATIGTATEDLPLGGAGFGFIGAKTAEQPCG